MLHHNSIITIICRYGRIVGSKLVCTNFATSLCAALTAVPNELHVYLNKYKLLSSVKLPPKLDRNLTCRLKGFYG